MEISWLFIGCACVSWAVAWMASRKHIGGTAIVVILAGIVTLAMQRYAIRHWEYSLPEWAYLLVMVWDMIFLAGCATYVWDHCEMVTVAGVTAFIRRVFADKRRRSAMRADVRRAAKQYSWEVA